MVSKTHFKTERRRAGHFELECLRQLHDAACAIYEEHSGDYPNQTTLINAYVIIEPIDSIELNDAVIIWKIVNLEE